jgi:restriction system protein
VFITTSRFSKDARECAARSSDSLVPLDGQELADLMIERKVGLAVKETFALLDIDSDYFDDA